MSEPICRVTFPAAMRLGGFEGLMPGPNNQPGNREPIHDKIVRTTPPKSIVQETYRVKCSPNAPYERRAARGPAAAGDTYGY